MTNHTTTERDWDAEPETVEELRDWFFSDDNLPGATADRFDFEPTDVGKVYPQGGAGSGSLAVRRNQYGDANVPSAKQEAFLTSLLKAKLAWTGTAQEYVAALGQGWTKKFASRAIDMLLKEEDLVAESAAPLSERKDVRPNRYGSKCRKCGNWVEAEAGVLVGSAGNWGAEHKDGECPAAKVEVEECDCPEGMHRLADGRIYKVQIAHHGSGRPYAKILITRELADGTHRASFEYAQGAIRNLSSATLMTMDEAKAYGALYGVCCVCAAVLTDERSIAAGIGPVCAGKF